MIILKNALELLMEEEKSLRNNSRRKGQGFNEKNISHII